MDCGPTCLRMIAKYYGRNYNLQRLREISGINREGVSLLGISEAAENLGFKATGVRLSLAQLTEIELPCILHWKQSHFVVLYRIKGAETEKPVFFIADPAGERLEYTLSEMAGSWTSRENGEQLKGIGLLLSPTPDFYQKEGDPSSALDMRYFLSHILKYRQLIRQLVIGLTAGSLLQLVLPFLTQAVVDIGINTKNLNFVYIILIAQTMLFLGRLSIDFMRSWILLHISTRLNITILTDFLIKLMKLPMTFFDTKMTGDIMQRMTDQSRIQNFLTGSSLNTIFSMFNLLIFSFVLAYYNLNIFIIFMIFNVLYSLWTVFFLKKRRALDFKRFDISSQNQSNVVELITGMQEIKLNNCELQKRWEWERIQAGLFNFSIKSLVIGQYQQFGTFLLNEGKNMLITLIVARSVIDGQLSIGAMMAIQYIVGQLNSPIEQLLGFVQQFQDAKISLERLNEIHALSDEEPVERSFIKALPEQKSISLHDLSFTYPGAGNEPVFQNLSFHIPEGKTTAIVGMSGSGKTTILKLLLRFYETSTGEINVGPANLQQISYGYWRSRCGIVMQDGFIFSDTIGRNIAVGDEHPDKERLSQAIDAANIRDFIEEQPLGLATKIGTAGKGISQGQRQRILIARAVYKNPDYIFFDEATNALDANNEKKIMENLESFFKGRTVVVVAHRLSTVRNADQIIVLNKGAIVEQGNHASLSKSRGAYYELVKNQLELGS